MDEMSVDALFTDGRSERNMKGILAVVFALSAVVLYGCIRAGAREDRLMEELGRKGKENAGGENR